MRLIEFILIYLLAPILMAVFLPVGLLFAALITFCVAGLFLLHLTDGFQWRSLIEGASRLTPRPIIATSIVTMVVGIAIIYHWHPDALFIVPRERPKLMLVITIFYPILSVLPQELIYRVLYFRRYGDLLPGGTAGLTLNAALFSFGHLMYWSWTVAILTFAGGLIFAWAYETRRSFALAVVLHSVTGILFFAIGMGIYFYSGNVQRPF